MSVCTFGENMRIISSSTRTVGVLGLQLVVSIGILFCTYFFDYGFA